MFQPTQTTTASKMNRWKTAMMCGLLLTVLLVSVQPAEAQVITPRKDLVSSYFGWDPNTECWRSIELYWDVVFVHDLEWLDDNCFIARRDICLVIEETCTIKDPDGQEVVVEGSRSTDSCYVVAELHCREDGAGGWDPDHPAKISKEESTREPTKEAWNVDGEFWEEQ